MFKVRNYVPCVLSNMNFDVDLPEEDEVQVGKNYCSTKVHVHRLSNLDTLGTEESVLVSGGVLSSEVVMYTNMQGVCGRQM